MNFQHKRGACPPLPNVLDGSNAYSLRAGGGEWDIPHAGPSTQRLMVQEAGEQGESSFFVRNPMAFAVVRLSVSAASSSQGFWVLTTYFLFDPLRLCQRLCLWRLAWNNLKITVFFPSTQRKNIASQSKLRVLRLSQKWCGIRNERRDPGACHLKDSMTASWIFSLKLVSL